MLRGIIRTKSWDLFTDGHMSGKQTVLLYVHSAVQMPRRCSAGWGHHAVSPMWCLATAHSSSEPGRTT